MGVLLAIEDCLRYDDVCIVVIGPTLKQTREIVAPRLRRIAMDAPHGLIRPSKSEGKWYIGTSELVMGGMDVNSSAQRGKTVQNVYIEEIVDSRPDDYLESLRSDIGPALTHSKGGKIIYLTTLPKVPDHPFITETMPRASLNNALFVYTIDDNIALTPAQYDACVRRSGGRHTDEFRREYLCQVIRDRNIVIVPDFNKNIHICDSAVRMNDMTVEGYIDWGGVRDKTAALLMGYDYLRAMDYVIDELVWPHNTPTDTIVKDIRAKWDAMKVTRYYADAPGQLQVDLASAHQFDISLPMKSDWEAAVNNMSNRFTLNKILINPKCRMLIESCQSGTFNKNRTDFDRSAALGHMDAIAALMYGVRCLDRSTPFRAEAQNSDWQWRPLKVVGSEPINIKQFGKPKRFV